MIICLISAYQISKIHLNKVSYISYSLIIFWQVITNITNLNLNHT